jgi:hypothetical protein
MACDWQIAKSLFMAHRCRNPALAPTSANRPFATVRRRKRYNGRKVGHCGSNCRRAKTSILTQLRHSNVCYQLLEFSDFSTVLRPYFAGVL